MKLFLKEAMPVRKDDVYLYCLLVVVAMPIIYILLNEKFSYMVLNMFALIVFVAIFLFRGFLAIIKKQKITIFKSKAFIILTIMYLLIFISTFFAYDKSAAWLGVRQGFLCEIGFIQYLFFYVVAYCAINLKRENIKYLLYLLLAVSTTIIIIQFFKQDYHYGFVNRNHTGFYLSITTMIATGLFLFSNSITKSIIFAILSVLHFINLTLNSSFGPMLGLLAFFVVGFVYFLLHKRNLLAKFGIIFLCFMSVIAFFDYVPNAKKLKCEPETTIEKVVGVSVVVLNKIGVISDEKYSDINIASGSDGWGRLSMWQRCLQNMKERPLFGVGVGSWKSYNQDISLQTPHNEFLQYGTFAGIPCLIAYLVLIFYIFFKFRKNHKNMSNLSFLMFGAIFVYLIQSFFGSVMPFTAPTFYLILGLSIKAIDNIH